MLIVGFGIAKKQKRLSIIGILFTMSGGLMLLGEKTNQYIVWAGAIFLFVGIIMVVWPILDDKNRLRALSKAAKAKKAEELKK